MSGSTDDLLIDGKPLSELRVIDLKESLEARGLSKSGSKHVLMMRLRDSLALERIQEEQSGKDPDSAPNMEMKSCGSDIVAQYLEKQQQALLAAKKAAQAARAGQSGERCSSASAGSTSVDDQLPPEAASTTTPVPGASDDEGGAATASALAATTDTTTATTNTTTATTNTTTATTTATDQAKIEDETLTEENIKETEASNERNLDESQEISAGISEQNKIADSKMEEVRDKAETEVRTDEVVFHEEKNENGEKQDAAEISDESNQLQQTIDRHEMTSGDAQVDLSSVPVQPADLIKENGIEKSAVESPEPESSNAQSTDEKEPGSSNESAGEHEDGEQVDYSRRSEDKQQTVEYPAEKSSESMQQSMEETYENIERNNITDQSMDAEAIPVDSSFDRNYKDGALAEEKPRRKRRWGSTTVGKRATVSISSDSLKEIVGHVKTTDALLTSTIEEQVQLDYDEEPLPKRIVIPRDDGDEEDAAAATTATKEEITIKKEEAPKKLRLNRLSDPTLYDEGFIRERPPSPARRAVSNIIHIRCLTRPFTVKLLLEFLSTMGKVVKEDFWIDNIKSHCFVKYEVKEDAITAREKLDNIRWPLSNPNVLHAEFASESDLERHRQKSKENGRPTGRVADTSQNSFDILRPKERTVREIISNRPLEGRQSGRSPMRDQKAEINPWPKRREWDKGKEEWRNGRSPSPQPSPDKYGRNRLPSPSNRRLERSNEVATVKVLEDLFRKTKTTPCLYWLPLSQEQIAEKQKNRKKRAMERAEKLKLLEEEEREREREIWKRKEVVRTEYRDSSKFERNRRR